MPHRIINNDRDLNEFVLLASKLAKPFTVEWQLGRDRSLEQNRLQFLWAREAAEQRGDMSADEVRCEWKLVHGVPILREESAEFREIYDAAIKPLHDEFVSKLSAGPRTDGFFATSIWLAFRCSRKRS